MTSQLPLPLLLLPGSECATTSTEAIIAHVPFPLDGTTDVASATGGWNDALHDDERRRLSLAARPASSIVGRPQATATAGGSDVRLDGAAPGGGNSDSARALTRRASPPIKGETTKIERTNRQANPTCHWGARR